MKKFTEEQIQKLSVLMDKVAADSSTKFNETPPAANTEQLEAQKAESAEESSAPIGAESVPAETPVVAPMEASVEAPVQEGPEAAGARAAQSFLGPEVMQAAMSGDQGAADLVSRTAGQVAGAVTEALTRSGAAAPSPMGGGMPTEEGIVPRQGAAAVPAVATPEEDLANEIVPEAPPAAVPAAPGVAPVPGAAPNAAPGTPPAPGAPTDEVNASPEGGEEQGVIDKGKGSQTTVAPGQNAAPAPAEAGGEKVDMTDVKKLLELARSGKI